MSQCNPFVAHRPAPEPWENSPTSTVAITALRESDIRSNTIRTIWKKLRSVERPTRLKCYRTVENADFCGDGNA